MVHIKRGNVARKRRKKILFLAKGFRGTHSKLFRVANEQILKALRYTYIGRKHKKIKFRQLWIIRINSIVRKFCLIKYSSFISQLRYMKILLNRKMLAQFAIFDTIILLNLIKKNN